jgi:hypothetical protein
MHNAGADKETIPDAMASGISCSGSAVHLARVEPTTRFSTDGDSIQQLIQPGPLNHRQVSPENHGSLQSVRSCFVVDQASRLPNDDRTHLESTSVSVGGSANEQGVAHAAIARRHHTETSVRYLAGALVLFGVALTRKHPTRGTTQPDAKSGTQATRSPRSATVDGGLASGDA